MTLKLLHISCSLPVLVIGKDVFKNIKGYVIRAIKGKIQSQAVAVNYLGVGGKAFK